MTSLAFRIELDRGNFRLSANAELPLQGITVVFGPSGSGKTSLLRVIAGLEPTAQGELKCGTEEWISDKRQAAAHNRRVALVFQEGRLFSHLDVLGNLRFPLRLGRQRQDMALDDVIDALDLRALLARNATTLSGGEQKRVAIGRALLSGPQLLAMDEPLTGLDRAARHEILRYIKALPARFDLPVLHVTHSLSELASLADRVVVMHAGRIVNHGPLRDVVAAKSLAEVSDPLAPAIVEARVREHRNGITVLDLGGTELALPQLDAKLNADVRLLIHPEDVVIALTEPTRISIRNSLPVRIVELQSTANGHVMLTLDMAQQRFQALITQAAATELGVEPGQNAYALIKSIALGASLND